MLSGSTRSSLLRCRPILVFSSPILVLENKKKLPGWLPECVWDPDLYFRPSGSVSTRYGTDQAPDLWDCAQGCGSVFIFYGSGSRAWWRRPIRIRIQYGSRALMTKNWKKITAENFFKFFFWSKTSIYLSLGLHKVYPSYRRSLQFSKEAIQHFKTWTFTNYCLLFWVIFALLDPDPDPYSEYGSGSTLPIEYGSNTDPDPDPQPCVELSLASLNSDPLA